MDVLGASLHRVPEYREFLTFDELRARARALVGEFPGVARLETAGASAEGRPIELLTVGHGRRPVLLVGVPHPNEPIGTLTVDFLSPPPVRGRRAAPVARRHAVRHPRRRPRRPGAERGLVQGRFLAAALRAHVLSSTASRAGRVELPGRLQDAPVHHAGPRDRDGDARHGAGAPAPLLLAAQRRVLRRVLLRLRRPPGAVPRLARAGRNAGAAAPSRRARGAVSEDAGAGRVRAVRHRRARTSTSPARSTRIRQR